MRSSGVGLKRRKCSEKRELETTKNTSGADEGPERWENSGVYRKGKGGVEVGVGEVQSNLGWCLVFEGLRDLIEGPCGCKKKVAVVGGSPP